MKACKNILESIPEKTILYNETEDKNNSVEQKDKILTNYKRKDSVKAHFKYSNSNYSNCDKVCLLQ